MDTKALAKLAARYIDPRPSARRTARSGAPEGAPTALNLPRCESTSRARTRKEIRDQAEDAARIAMRPLYPEDTCAHGRRFACYNCQAEKMR